jgi:hypothetical protein
MTTRFPSRTAPVFLALGIALVPSLTGVPGSPRAGSDVVRYTMELPAVDLEPHADHHDAPQPPAVEVVLPVGGMVRGFTVEVVDRDGAPVPPTILHHVQLFDPARRDLFNPYMLRVVGAGGETGGGSVPWPFGYRVEAGDTLLVAAMLHNPTGSEYAGVTVRLSLEFSRGGMPGRRPIHPFFHHVTDPDSSTSYDLPPGRSEQSWEITPEVDGRILGMGGHLHRYGVEVRLEDVTRGQVLWTGKATLDEDGHVVSITRGIFALRGGIPLRSDRRYRVVAVHDNPTGATLVGEGMGTLGGVVRLARGASWPRADRSDPRYLADLEAQRSVGGHHGSGAMMPGGHGHHQH